MSDREIKAGIEAAESAGLDIEAEINRLAVLSKVEYEACRKDEAKRLGFRTSVLDDAVQDRRPRTENPKASLDFSMPEPWPDAVNGAQLLDDIVSAIRRFVVLPEGGAETMALWVLHAHAHEAAFNSPLLAFTSPEKRCGKTTALKVLQRLVPKPLPTSNITAPAVFRSIDKWGPTLLVDEADTFLRDSDELRGVLNSGHSRDQAFLIRCEGINHLKIHGMQRKGTCMQKRVRVCKKGHVYAKKDIIKVFSSTETEKETTIET